MEITPVLCGSAFKNKGVQTLIDSITELLPSPLEIPPIVGSKVDDSESTEERKSDVNSPFTALAFKIAKTPEVKVFAFEGEGGLTTGASHETMNSAWGLGLGNLIYFLDWNDFGIDPRPFSSIVYGTPEDWFGSHGWHVEGTMDGENWGELTKSYYKLLIENEDPKIPKVIYGRFI